MATHRGADFPNHFLSVPVLSLCVSLVDNYHISEAQGDNDGLATNFLLRRRLFLKDTSVSPCGDCKFTSEQT